MTHENQNMNDNAGREASLATAPCSAPETVRPPNLVQAGQLWVMESEDSEEPDEISFALLIQCSNADQVREAMRTGKINFTIFEHYSHVKVRDGETGPHATKKDL